MRNETPEPFETTLTPTPESAGFAPAGLPERDLAYEAWCDDRERNERALAEVTRCVAAARGRVAALESRHADFRARLAETVAALESMK